MSEQIEQVSTQALSELEVITEPEALEAWRIAYLGTKGTVKKLMNQIGSLSKEERPAVGQAVNVLKNQLTASYEARAELLRNQELAKDLEEGEIDITLPGRAHP